MTEEIIGPLAIEIIKHKDECIAYLDAALIAANARIMKLEAERDAAVRETGALRDGITKTIGMEWRSVPQPVGEPALVCPDDQEIVAACGKLRDRLRCALKFVGQHQHEWIGNERR